MRLGMVTALVVVCAAYAAGEDWPRFRGAHGDGISREKGINKNWVAAPPKRVWRMKVGDQGFAGPSIAHGKLFFVDHDGDDDVVRALNVADGSEVWHYRYPEVPKKDMAYARATPTVEGGKVYTCSRTGIVNCLDEKSGKLIWTVSIVKDLAGRLPDPWEASASPVIDGNKLFVVTGTPDKPVAALDKDTGKVLWQGGANDYPSYASPVIAKVDGRMQCVAFLGTTLQGLDPDSGAVIWKCPWVSGNIAQPVPVGPSSIYVSTQYNVGSGLMDVKGSEVKARWTNKSIQAHFNTPVLIDGYFYGTADPGFLMCIEAATGKIVWKEPGFEKGGLLAVDGTLIVINGSNGDVSMVEVTPKAYHFMGKLEGLTGTSWSPPILADRKLIVRNMKEMTCWDLSTK